MQFAVVLIVEVRDHRLQFAAQRLHLNDVKGTHTHYTLLCSCRSALQETTPKSYKEEDEVLLPSRVQCECLRTIKVQLHRHLNQAFVRFHLDLSSPVIVVVPVVIRVVRPVVRSQ